MRVVVVLASLLALSFAACGEKRPAADPEIGGVVRGPSGFYGSALPEPRPAPPMRLVEHGGRTFDLAEQRGRVVLLFFGYTHCPDVCPTTLADWRRVKGELGADTAKVRFVFVSTDPARDTPEVAQSYARRFDPSFIGLTGDSATLATLQRAFMVASVAGPRDTAHADPHAGHTSYEVAHSSRTFVIDRAGQWRLLLPAGGMPAAITADVKKLLAE